MNWPFKDNSINLTVASMLIQTIKKQGLNRGWFGVASRAYSKFEPTFPKPKKQPVKPDMQQETKNSNGIFSRILAQWNQIPFRARLWIGASTFVVALGGDYLSDRIYENAKLKEEAERLADEELAKMAKA